MNVTATDPMQGVLLEQRYRIRGKIAQGGMAAVYEAFDERLERIVAVKIMHPTYAADPIFASRFMREARSAAALNHPHIVAVFDEGRHGDSTFLVMEKVDGTTLRGVLQQRGRLSPEQALGVMEPVLAALAQAHERGIAHRDVKPENVLISPTGLVKVADFGLARAVEGGPQLTNRNTLLGTVAYLAPEQIADGHSDARSDVYAAGVMLYELLTGVKPFQGASAIDVAYQHVSTDIPPPSTAVPELPAALDELVARATRRDRHQRLATAGAFLAVMRQTRQTLGITLKLVKAAVPTGATGLPSSTDVASPDSRPVGSDPQASAAARTPDFPAAPGGAAAPPTAHQTPGGTSVLPVVPPPAGGLP
ncbi:MAG: protein kinase domain-containing protein, partial [Mycobacteriales bacterium]